MQKKKAWADETAPKLDPKAFCTRLKWFLPWSLKRKLIIQYTQELKKAFCSKTFCNECRHDTIASMYKLVGLRLINLRLILQKGRKVSKKTV